nr:unnamed protein product [Callosobruchus chinensis]
MIDQDSHNNGIPTYPEWSSKKNMMLSSFFWGYIILQVGVGQLAKNYGPKWLIGGAAFVGSAFCALLPLSGHLFGYQGVIACRVLTGLTQGFIYPCGHNLISAWTPLQDRAKIGSFVYAGGPLGTVISLPIAGFISSSAVGWPVVFYLYGALGMVWAIIWFLIGSNSPSADKFISKEEKEYIEAGIEAETEGEKVPTPWKEIFTSLPFWGVLIAHCGQNFGFWTLLTEIPSYMQNILHFDIKSNSTLSALPYLVMWLLSLVMSYIADNLIIKEIVTVGTSRKIFNSIGLFVPATALVGLSLVGESHYVWAIALLVTAVGFNSAVLSGYNVNHIDLSPVHAGTLMGITNSVSNMFSLVSPLIVDVVRLTTGDKSLWTIVFCIASSIYLFVGVFYDVVASGEVQPWNLGSKKTEENIKMEPI